VRHRRALGALLGVLAFGCPVAAASADSATSTNWAGYAVHRTHVHFRSVYGAWVQPTASCVRGYPTYSAMWVGLGGYSTSSQALEQIGTETDCTSSGKVSQSAWYEMVPSASRNLSLHIHAGDSMAAQVTVSGTTTTLTLSDHTTHQSTTKRVRTSVLDTTSAEWILEAPSACTDSGTCTTLPLADFGNAEFTRSSVVSTTGHTGTITDHTWGTTSIRLLTGGGGRRQFVVYRGVGSAIGTATPSALTALGSAFSLAFAAATPSGPGAPVQAAAASAGSGATHIVHPLR
jgi:hypothetical protein